LQPTLKTLPMIEDFLCLERPGVWPCCTRKKRAGAKQRPGGRSGVRRVSPRGFRFAANRFVGGAARIGGDCTGKSPWEAPALRAPRRRFVCHSSAAGDRLSSFAPLPAYPGRSRPSSAPQAPHSNSASSRILSSSIYVKLPGGIRIPGIHLYGPTHQANGGTLTPPALRLGGWDLHLGPRPRLASPAATNDSRRNALSVLNTNAMSTTPVTCDSITTLPIDVLGSILDESTESTGEFLGLRLVNRKFNNAVLNRIEPPPHPQLRSAIARGQVNSSMRVISQFVNDPTTSLDTFKSRASEVIRSQENS